MRSLLEPKRYLHQNCFLAEKYHGSDEPNSTVSNFNSTLKGYFIYLPGCEYRIHS